MFKSLLIANRGEIACRIMDTAKKMGIRTIAVYSDADTASRHVRIADEAVHIGPAEAAKSYLDIGKILAAAKAAGAEAIHPGYGFLSENPDFADACVAAGVVFVGPSAKSMRQMALKDQAKKLMEDSGVPVTPGYHDKNQDDLVLAEAAANIGYPVLIKAVAGGGGRGMRLVECDDEFASQLESARRESLAAFGNDKVLIEKFIQNPRHIEVQVFGDVHGDVVHFFERDCSVQRRHQKVIEEAPAPGMTAKVRSAMTDAAIKAASAVNYVNAGTVEFIVDGSGPLNASKFWFMEMNTRLQVEHPVSEAITGFDLVQLQLEVAAGGSLPKQEQIKLTGHAVEARLYAEQPDKEFMPSTGKLDWFAVPSSGHIRLDTGFEQGDEVSSFYDPMLGKVIAIGTDRKSAISLLATALEKAAIGPVKTNAGFVLEILETQAFQDGTHDTGFIGDNMQKLLQSSPDLTEIAALCVVKGFDDKGHLQTDAWQGGASGWRLNGPNMVHKQVSVSGICFDVARVGSFSEFDVFVDGNLVQIPDILQSAASSLSDGFGPVFYRGEFFDICKPDLQNDASQVDASSVVCAPMPGKILELRAKAGDEVRVGDVLLVMEAMKMEQQLSAPKDGVVAKILFAPGDQVTEGQLLVSFEA